MAMLVCAATAETQIIMHSRPDSRLYSVVLGGESPERALPFQEMNQRGCESLPQHESRFDFPPACHLIMYAHTELIAAG